MPPTPLNTRFEAPRAGLGVSSQPQPPHTGLKSRANAVQTGPKTGSGSGFGPFATHRALFPSPDSPRLPVSESSPLTLP